jgi:hypothetical protein
MAILNQKFFFKFPVANLKKNFGLQNPGSGTGSRSGSENVYGSAIRKIAGSGSASALNQYGSTTLLVLYHILESIQWSKP